MNAYEQRDRLRKMAAEDKRKEHAEVMAMHRHSLMSIYEKAYKEANNQEAEIKYDRGWYLAKAKRGALGYTRMREKDLIDAIRLLQVRAADHARRASMEGTEDIG